MGRFDPQLA